MRTEVRTIQIKIREDVRGGKVMGAQGSDQRLVCEQPWKRV